jgi:pimeloyl-ACP methyl ester carboxylesterase
MKALLVIFLITLFDFGQPPKKTTYILVHGAWHGAWAWKKVVPLLEATGKNILAVDLPGHGADTTTSEITFTDYVQKVVDLANGQQGSVILIGHSMAGVVISQAAEILGKEKTSKLIYLDAFMPQNGESVFSMAEKAQAKNLNKKNGPTLLESLIYSDNKTRTKLKSETVKHLFYHDCSPEDVIFAQNNLGWQSMSCLATPVAVTESRYGAIPKFYILCTQAHDLDKTFLSTNVHCQKVYTLNSSHSPFFSMPERLVEIINEI